MGVGKTSILSQFTKKVFPESPLPTIAIEFATKNIQIKEGGYVKAQIWDTAGQEKYKSITSHHYRRAFGALLVYDVTRKGTFENSLKWYYELQKYAEKDCIIALVGNKIDLVNKNERKREVTREEGEFVAKQNQMLFFEASAKSNYNISDCFEELLQQIYNEKRKKGNMMMKSMILTPINEREGQNDIGCC